MTVEGLHYSGPVLQNCTHFEQYRKLYFKGSFLTAASPNNCVFLENNDIPGGTVNPTVIHKTTFGHA